MSRWRHLTVAIGLIPALIIYIGFAMQIADMVTNIHLVLDFAFIWLLALRIPWLVKLLAGWRTGATSWLVLI